MSAEIEDLGEVLRRQLTVGWFSTESLDEALGDHIWEWLDEHGALDVWMGTGPDKHPGRLERRRSPPRRSPYTEGGTMSALDDAINAAPDNIREGAVAEVADAIRREMNKDRTIHRLRTALENIAGDRVPSFDTAITMKLIARAALSSAQKEEK